MMDGWSAFGWLWMFIPVLFWGGLLTLIVWAIVRVFPTRGGERPDRREGSVEDVLRSRFARGEIGAEEYERSLEVLRGERTTSNGSV